MTDIRTALLDSIKGGDRVTIINRFGQERTGSAVFRGPAGWVLDMGGAHGIPGIATAENITKVRATNRKTAQVMAAILGGRQT